MIRTPAAIIASLVLSAPAFAGQQMQGQQMQGQQMQGQQMQGTGMAGTGPVPASAAMAPPTVTTTPTPTTEAPLSHRYTYWYIPGAGWATARLTAGRLSAVDGRGRVLEGSELVGAYVPADQGSSQIWTMISAASADPTFPDGHTWLYSIDTIASNGTRAPLCRTDANGVAAAIPVAAVFNTHGDRVESSVNFTFSCTAGVIAKCYRWGYMPWLDGAGTSTEFARLHWACTRMARADYCGNGNTWTQNGTLINVWDRAPAPGPFQLHGSPPPGFLFEAGWSTNGAVCLSKQRWATLPPNVAASCPDRLIAPGVATTTASVCNTDNEAVQFDATTQLFNESLVNH